MAQNLNTAVGTHALMSNTLGSENSALGESALYSNATGSYNTATGATRFFSIQPVRITPPAASMRFG